jgi:ABC-type branched-subunit amino acid transport system substrate-binding protein
VVERSGRSRLLLRGFPLALGAALVLAGCGTSTTGGNSTVTVSGKTLTIYASQPPGGAHGQPEADILAAEQLAFAQSGGKVGPYRIRFKVLDGAKLSDNGRTAIEDQSAIAYLGELVPGTSQTSVEIVNQQGLLEVSPADTAVYLTQPIPPVSSTLTTFYPGHATFKETFARVVPNSGQEAKAIVGELGAQHATSLYVDYDHTQLYGAALALEVRNAAKAAGLTLATSASGAGAVFYGGSVANRAVAARWLDQTASASPSAKLFVPSGLYDSAFVASLSPAAQQRLVVSSPGFQAKDLNSDGKAFLSSFRSAYGHDPAPQAVFGYEAVQAVLAVLHEAGSAINSRAVVAYDFRNLKNRSSPIGTYSINGGDPSIAPFVLARVRGGKLVPFKFVRLAG